MPRNPKLFRIDRSNFRNPNKIFSLTSSMKSLSRFTKTLISLQRSLRPFSSSSSFTPKPSADRRGDAIDPSPAYLRSLLRRPPTVKPWKVPRNSCSFIGTVIRPVKKYAGDNPRSNCYTVLEVKRPSRGSDPCSSSSPSSFKILLEMRGKLSGISMRYLKPSDYIYVCGSLSSYEKVGVDGKREIFYRVAVTELNFVTRNDTNQISQKPENAAADPTVGTSYTEEINVRDTEEMYRDHLRLWQVFFANPQEWWDNRRGKRNPRWPDFKHKDTKECLWLNPDDPPWVRKQLQLYDSSMGGVHHSRPDAFDWKLKDFV